MLSKLLLLWMRPLMRRSDGLPWLVLTEEAAVTEPAVGLGCILRWAEREQEEEGGKQQHHIRANKLMHIFNTAGESATSETKEDEEAGFSDVSAFQNATAPLQDKMAFKEIYNWI